MNKNGKDGNGVVPRKLARRAAYSLAAGAATLSGAESKAVVVYSGEENIDIGQGFSQNLNLDGDAYNDILLKNYIFFGGNYQGLYVNFAPGKVIGFSAALAYATALSADELIDSSATADGVFQASMAYGPNNPNAEFNDVDGAFLGLEFPINATSHFGWIRVSIDNAAGTFIVHDWAYDDEPGVGIVAGDTGPLGLPGDYNGDGLVGGIDYAVWRDNLGATEDDLLNGNGTGGDIDHEDFELWLDNYGATNVSSEIATATPEPISLGLLAAGAVGVAALRSSRSRTATHDD